MPQGSDLPALVSTFTVGMLHSLMPTHWLCFVLVGRARGWSLRRTLAITAGAGLGHVGSTILLGIGALLAARTFLDPGVLRAVSAAALLATGALYLALHFVRAGHRHARDSAPAQRAAVASLVLALFLSPCEAVIPIFVAVAGADPWLVALLCVVLLAAGVGTTLILTALSYAGMAALRLEAADRYEKLIVGLILTALGASVLALR